MTRLLVDPATDFDDPAAVTLTATLLDPGPTLVRTFTGVDAATVVDLPAPGAAEAWRLTVRRSARIVEERTVRFGGPTPLAWAALTDVDPATLHTTAVPGTAWDAAIAELRAKVDNLPTTGGGGGGFSGAYADLTGKPAIPTSPADIGADPAGTADARIAALVDGAPDALNTLKELAAQLATDEGAAAGLATAVAGKEPAGLSTGTKAALDAAYPAKAASVFRPGRQWLFLGDSITNGSNARNFAYSFAPQAGAMAGTQYVAADSIEAGSAGYTSAQLLAWLPAVIAGQTFDAAHVQIGTNDAGQSVPLATFQTNATQIVALLRKAGKAVTIGTVPPRSAATVTTTMGNLIAGYNAWLRLWAPTQGVELAEVHAALADPTTGNMLALYDSGDGTHPTTLGHTKIAQAVAAAMLRAYAMTARPSLVTGVNPALNLLANPLMTASGTDPAGSFSAIASGTAPVRSIIADTSGALPFGQWAQVDLTAAVDSAFGRAFSVTAAGANTWQAGDTLVLHGRIQVTDLSGTWEAQVSANTAEAYVDLFDGGSGVRIGRAIDHVAGRPAGGGVFDIGPAYLPLVIPAGTTSLTVRYGMAVPSGAHYVARFGTLGLLRVAALGLTPGGKVMANLDGP